MKRPPPPLQFVGGVLLLWVTGRTLALLPPGMVRGADIAPSALADMRARIPISPAPSPTSAGLVLHAGAASHRAAATPLLLARADPAPARAAPFLLESSSRAVPPGQTDAASNIWPGFGEPVRQVAAERASPSRSRWSGDAYLFARPGGGVPSLAAGGALGGSQAAARIAYALNRDGPPRLAIAARVYAPLDSFSGSEGAVGIDWHPLPKAALRVSVERRFDTGGAGRSAWSAYAAGGFYKGGLPGGLEADVYAQAGVVGARRGDVFVDGALRVARPIPLDSSHVLRVGVAAWGAAQPDVARLDVGPRMALGLPLGRTNVTAALDYRARIFGDAAPHSGFAFTLAAGF